MVRKISSGEGADVVSSAGMDMVSSTDQVKSGGSTGQDSEVDGWLVQPRAWMPKVDNVSGAIFVNTNCDDSLIMCQVSHPVKSCPAGVH